jgi:hypothetical protein
LATDYIVPDSYATIALAVAAAEAVGPAGGIARVRIKAGTYTEVNVTFTIDWTRTAWLAVESWSGARDVKLDIHDSASATDKVFVCASKKCLKFRNLELTAEGNVGNRQGFTNCTEAVFQNVLLHHVSQNFGSTIIQNVFEDCESHHGNYAGFVSGGPNTFRRCKAHHNGRGGFESTGRYPDLFLSCAALRNTLSGFYFSYSAVGHFEHFLAHCVSFANTLDGLRIDSQGQTVRLLDCVFRSNTLYGVRLPAARADLLFDPLPRSEANCYSGNGSGILHDGTNTVTTLAGMQTYTGQDALSTVADPLFTTETDGSENFDLQAGSTLKNAGIDAGAAFDWKSVTFPDPHHPAIGCAANRDVELDLWPAAGKVVSGAAFDQPAQATGTRTDCAAADARKDVAFGDPAAQITGLVNVPAAASVLKDVPVDQTVGSFDEAARNTDPGVANVVKDVTWKLQNVTKTGTFDEAARNVDPTAAKVLAPTAYKILNVAKEGTYEPPDPQVPTVQPVLDSVVVAQATGLVTAAWSPGHASAHVFLYRRLEGVAQKTLVGELTGAGPHDDLSALAHGTYWYSVGQELDDGGDPSGFPGRPDSAELALDWTGATPEYSPVEDFQEQLADCAAWQAWCATADRAVALAHTHAQVYEPTNLAAELPYAVVLDAEQLKLEAAGLGAFIPSGSVMLKLCVAAEGATDGAAVEACSARLRALQLDLVALHASWTPEEMNREEVASGSPTCPRCTGVELRKVIYKREDGRNEKLHCCPDCLFMIRRGDLIGMGG